MTTTTITHDDHPDYGTESLSRTIAFRVDLDDETISALIDTAGYGINYWCVGAVVNDDKRIYTVFPNPDYVDGGRVKRQHKLTYTRIRDAIVELAMANPKVFTFPEWFQRELRENDIAGDSDVGDLIIQQACFGEIIFG